MEIISQCGSGGMKDYKASRINLAKKKLEGQIDVVKYSRIIVPEGDHMIGPAGGYVDMLKANKSARGLSMALHDKQAGIPEGVSDGFKPEKKIVWYRDVIGSGRRRPRTTCQDWRMALQKCFDVIMYLITFPSHRVSWF